MYLYLWQGIYCSVNFNLFVTMSVYLYLSQSFYNYHCLYKTEYMCYNQTGDITTLDGAPLKLVEKFTYLGRSYR